MPSQNVAAGALALAVQARKPVLLWGGPGTGKSDVYKRQAQALRSERRLRETSTMRSLPLPSTWLKGLLTCTPLSPSPDQRHCAHRQHHRTEHGVPTPAAHHRAVHHVKSLEYPDDARETQERSDDDSNHVNPLCHDFF